MRIGIDAKWFFKGTPGIKTHIRNLILALQNIDRENEYMVYFNRDGATGKGFFYNERFSTRCISPSFTLLRVLLSFPIVMAVDRLDILWTQMFTPLDGRAIKVVTIHDIIFETHPEFFSRKELLYFRFMQYSALRADAVFTVSQYSKKMMVDRWGIRPEKITVTYNAIGDQYKPITEGHTLQRVRKKYGLPEQFVLYVGRINERKNLHRLIKAFLCLRDDGTKLIIAGESEGKCIQKNLITDSMKERVVLLGHVPDEDLPALYNLATVFAYVSIEEGFGIPVVEAMACGCPVLASNTSSMPEVVGDAGILVTPVEEENISEALYSLLSDKEKRDILSEKGLERAGRFSWGASAETALKAFEELGKKGGMVRDGCESGEDRQC